MRSAEATLLTFPTSPLLRAKLIPPRLGREHLVRNRLHTRLAADLDQRAVTGISGGPGYGKTALVARFVGDGEVDTAWYRLDESDRDPLLLWRYLVQSIRVVVPEFGEHSEGVIEETATAASDVGRLADLFVRDAEVSLSGRVHLVIDRVELLAGAEPCLRLLHRVIENLPDTLHLFIVGRWIPGLGLLSLAGRGSAVLMDGEDLAFTEDETGSVLNGVFGLAVEPDRVREIHRRTRGWITALQLLRATGKLERGVELPVDGLRGTEAEIFEWFGDEAYATSSAETREVLLDTAVLDVVDPDLVHEATGRADAHGALREVHRQGLFLSRLGGGRELYDWNPLFREFLVRKLHLERGTEGERRLHAAYGRAFRDRGTPSVALRHMIAASDTKNAAIVLEAHGRALLRGGFFDDVRRAVALAEAIDGTNATTEDLLGEAARLIGDFATAAAHLERALAVESDPARRAVTLQGLAFARFKLGRHDEARRAAEEGLALAEGRDPTTVARILNTLSILHYLAGEHAEAIQGWQTALAAARSGDDPYLPLMIAHNLGLPHAVVGDFDRALECFRILTSGDNPRLGPEEAAAHLNLARIATIRGELDEARARLADARDIAERLGLRALSADVLEAQGNLLREVGEHVEAADKYRAARARFTELGMHDLIDNLAEEEALLDAERGELERAATRSDELVDRARGSKDRDRLASALLARGVILVRGQRTREACAALEESAAHFAAAGRAYQECVARSWLAAGHRAAGDRERARDELEAALRLASRHGYRRAVERVQAFDPELAGLTPRAFADSERASTAVAPAAPPPVDLRIRMLGTFEVEREGELLPPSVWKLRKAARIFCFIASARGQRVAKERVVDAIWPDASPAVVRKNFHPAMSFVRRALNLGRQVPKSFVVYEAGGYRLDPGYRYAIDTEELERQIETARRAASTGGVATALAGYDRALALYRGPFLADLDDAWIDAPRAHYATLYRTALADSAEILLARGEQAAAIERLEHLVAADPLDESVSIRLMDALAAGGRRGDVEREFRRLERALAKAFSVEPSVPTRKAYRGALGRSVQP